MILRKKMVTIPACSLISCVTFSMPLCFFLYLILSAVVKGSWIRLFLSQIYCDFIVWELYCLYWKIWMGFGLEAGSLISRGSSL